MGEVIDIGETHRRQDDEAIRILLDVIQRVVDPGGGLTAEEGMDILLEKLDAHPALLRRLDRP